LREGLKEGDVIQTLRRLNARPKIKAAYPMFDLDTSFFELKRGEFFKMLFLRQKLNDP